MKHPRVAPPSVLLLSIALLVTLGTVAIPSNAVPLVPYGPSTADIKIPPSDETSTPITLETAVTFAGRQYGTVYLGDNGYLGFGDSFNTFLLPYYVSAFDFPIPANFIVPCAYDYDAKRSITTPSSGIWHRHSTSAADLAAVLHILSGTGKQEFNAFSPTDLYVFTWSQLFPYLGEGSTSGNQTTFQLVLATTGTQTLALSMVQENPYGCIGMVNVDSVGVYPFGDSMESQAGPTLSKATNVREPGLFVINVTSVAAFYGVQTYMTYGRGAGDQVLSETNNQFELPVPFAISQGQYKTMYVSKYGMVSFTQPYNQPTVLPSEPDAAMPMMSPCVSSVPGWGSGSSGTMYMRAGTRSEPVKQWDIDTIDALTGLLFGNASWTPDAYVVVTADKVSQAGLGLIPNREASWQLVLLQDTSNGFTMAAMLYKSIHQPGGVYALGLDMCRGGVWLGPGQSVENQGSGLTNSIAWPTKGTNGRGIYMYQVGFGSLPGAESSTGHKTKHIALSLSLAGMFLGTTGAGALICFAYRFGLFTRVIGQPGSVGPPADGSADRKFTGTYGAFGDQGPTSTPHASGVPEHPTEQEPAPADGLAVGDDEQYAPLSDDGYGGDSSM